MGKLTADLIRSSPRIILLGRERLDLRGNKIPVIENLDATEDHFDTIDLSDNEIVKLENFPLLNRLGALIIRNNMITQINPNIGEFLPKLHTLVLTNNKLVNLVDIDPLASIPNLQGLSLVDNDITKKPNYRLHVIHKIKSLQLLDFISVEDKERDEAAALFSSKEAEEEVEESQKVPDATEEPETSTLVGLTREESLAIEAIINSGKPSSSDPMEVDDDYSVENDPRYYPELMIDSQGDSSVSDRPFDGFGRITKYGTRLKYFDYEYDIPWVSNRAMVYRFAELGIHRYNLLEGTAWELFSLKSFNKGMVPCAAPYFLTMVAFDPASWQFQPFQALVCEHVLGFLEISVDIARPQGLEEPPPLRRRCCEPGLPLPPWPSSEMITDTQLFYKLEEQELRNTPWVRLYLDLLHCTTNRSMSESELSDFHILQATIGSLDDAEPPRINSTNAVVYIVYRDLVKFRCGKPSELRAIIRRVYDESTRSLSIQGEHWRPSEMKRKKKKRFALLKKRLGVWGGWRLRLDVYRKRGIRSSSRTR